MALPDKEFKDLTIPELKAVAKTFAVDLDGKTRKSDIIKEIEQMGITWEMYEALDAVDDEPELPSYENGGLFEPTAQEVVNDGEAEAVVSVDEVEEPEPVSTVEPSPAEEDYVLLKMTRENRIYQIRGYTFTREHPYVLVTEDVANFLVENKSGFRAASPREVKEYYGG